MNRKEFIEQASKTNNTEVKKLLAEYNEAREKKKPVNKILNLLKETLNKTNKVLDVRVKNLLDYYKK